MQAMAAMANKICLQLDSCICPLNRQSEFLRDMIDQRSAIFSNVDDLVASNA